MKRTRAKVRKTRRSREQSLLELLDAIYSTVDDPQQWSTVLQSVAAHVNAEAASLFHVHSSPAANDEAEISVSSAREIEHEAFCFLNPLLLTPADPVLLPALVSDLLCPSESVLRTSFYQVSPGQAAVHAVTLTLHREPDFVARLRLLRGRGKPRFQAAQQRQLRTILPHLRRAVALRKQLVSFASSAGSAERALDCMPQAIFLLGPEQRILYANEPARALAAAQDGVEIRRGHLQLQDARARTALSVLLQGAAGASGGGAMRVQRRGRKNALTLLLAPFQSANDSTEESSPTVIAVITDPGTHVAPSPEVLARIYLLTAAEARLAQALAAGASLEEAAFSFHVTLETVRSQLKSVFNKTNTRRQSDLVRLLLGSALDLQKLSHKAAPVE